MDKYCDEHKKEIDEARRLVEENRKCRHVASFSRSSTWCLNKCDWHTESDESEPHFLDGTPCETNSECDFIGRQTECPKYEPKPKRKKPGKLAKFWHSLFSWGYVVYPEEGE